MSKTLARSRDNAKGLYGLVDKHANWLNQSLTVDSQPTFNALTITNDVTIGGDLTVNGMTTVINTDVLEVKDNIIEINSTEVGPGVTVPSGVSGVQVNRGASIAYQSVFREIDDTFCVGQIGGLQVVATREDNPLTNGVMIYNNSQNRLDSVTTLPLSITFNSGEVSNTSANGAVRIIGGVGITGDILTDGKLYTKGINYNNYIFTDTSQDTIINSSNGINLDVITNVKVPVNKPVIFGSTAQNIQSNGTNLILTSSGSINLLNTATNLTTNSPLTFGASSDKITYNGTNLSLDASNLFLVNPVTSFSNSTSSTNDSNGSVRISGGISLSNTQDSVNSTNGGTLTTAGGVGISKKLFVGGQSTFENVNDALSLSVNGGATVSKKLIVGSSYSGNPSSTPGIFIQSNGNTYNDSNTVASGVVSNVNFNYLGINALTATNTNISTTNSSTLYIEGAPVTGTNQTITNKYALNVAGGLSKFEGDVQIKSLTNSTSLVLSGGATINKNLNVNSKFNVGANIGSAPSSSGVFIALQSSTVTDDVTVSGTVGEMLFNVIGQPTLSSTNVITTTNSATFVLDGAPLQSGNQTITNPYSMWIKSGTFRTDSDIKILNTTEATSSNIGGTLSTLGGVGIAKKLFVGGVSTFENVSEATNSTTAGTVVKGGLAIEKNMILGKGVVLASDNFSGTPSLGVVLNSGGNTFTDSVTATSGTQSSFSTNQLKRTTLSATNTNVTTTNAHTLYIEGAPIQGANQTITNSYALTVANGNSQFLGGISVTGAITSTNNLTLQGDLDVNGHTQLDRVSIVTDDGQFSVTGTNPINMNVSNSCTLTNTTGNITIDSQNGTLVLDGNTSMTLDTLGSISIDGGASSNFNISSGTLTIGAPTLAISATTVGIGATSVVNIATTNSGIPINIGHSISETNIGGNLSVTGNFTVQGDTTILNSTIITTEDNAIVVNSMPNSVSDGGFLVKRYQTPNNTALGTIIQDTPYETGVFQGHLQLGTGASIITDRYKGWWIKITSGTGNDYVRRIKSSNSSRVITIYTTSDNGPNFSDGLDLGVTIQSGDTYSLFSGAYAGMFFNETEDEWSIGNVPFDQGAGVFPLFGYRDLHINALKVDAGLSLYGTTIVEGTIIIDNNDPKTLLVRKNGNVGDIFYINSIDSTMTMGNPINTIGTITSINFTGKDSTSLDVSYSQITSKIKVNTTTAVVGELSLGVIRNSILDNYIVLDGDSQTTTISSLTNLTNSTASTSSTASLKVTGGITSLLTTDATSTTSGGGLTVVGGASIGKKLYVGTDLLVNSTGTGTATLKINPSSQNGESSISFYGDLSYTGQLWKIGHGVPGVSTNSFGIYNGTTTSLALTVSSSNLVNIVSTQASSSSSTGALTVAGGVGISSDLNVGGNISGTWTGSTISVARGGTGVTTLTSTAVLLGNGTSAIVSGSDLTYSSSTLSLPKLISNDTTDSSSSITGAIITSGGLGVAKKAYIGTDLYIGGNMNFSSTDTSIGHLTADASDNGSFSIFSGGAYGNSRGANVLLKGNEHLSDAGRIVLECGNVNATGHLSIYTATFERFKVGYDGVITSFNTLDSTSSTVGSVVIAGGLSVAKKLYVGTDLIIGGNFQFTTVTAGTWNGSTITVPYGGTGATTLLTNGLLLGNGTGAIQTSSNITFATNTLDVPKITSTDTTQSTSSSTGAVTLLGGLGVAKNVYLGQSLFVNNFVGVSTSTNVNSALTLASGSNIGIDTVVSFDTGNLSISGSGVGLASRGSIINLYGIDHATLPGNINIQTGSTSGILRLTTGGTSRVDITNSGITTFSKTGDSTSSTTGAVIITGGVGISNSTNSSSSTNGGALTIAGGCAIGQDLYIGGNLLMTGTIPGAMTITSPSITTSSLVSITSITTQTIKLRKVSVERTLTCVFEVTPSAVRSTCSFEFTLPEVVTNLVNVYDVVFSVNGYLTDFTPVENVTAYGVVGDTKGKLRFTSGPSTAVHRIQITANYTI
jgi:hypothetical protein